VNSRWFIGIDGGGTRTRALVLDARGGEVARVSGPAALADPRDPEAAAAPIATVARLAAEAAGRALPCTALHAGIAGVGREPVRRSTEAAVTKLGLAEAVRVDTDAKAAFHDAFGDGPGILLISGTGSVAWGRNERGAEGRVGGWGSLLGDEGSGYAIGLEALRRVARAADGRGPTTALRRAILPHLGLDKAESLVTWAAEAKKADVAALVPVVVECTRAGDLVAAEIMSQAGDSLARHVLAVLDNLGPWSVAPAVALSGGLLQRDGPLRHAMEVSILERRLGLLDREPDAALGAARLAQALAG
jgi:glucosamine kinase